MHYKEHFVCNETDETQEGKVFAYSSEGCSILSPVQIVQELSVLTEPGLPGLED